MHPDDLDRVSDFFESIIFNNQHQALMQTSSSIRGGIARRGICSIFKFISLMFMLVGANLLTAVLEPSVLQIKQSAEQIVFVKNMPNFIMKQEPEQQQHHQREQMDIIQNLLRKNYTAGLKDFGCHKNICWRACFVEDHEKNIPWCFSSPKSHIREYHSCASTADCSPLWECLETCHL